MLLAACGGGDSQDTDKKFIFSPVDTSFNATEVRYPGNYKLQVLYTEGDPEKVEWKGIMAPGKGKQDFIVYLPIDSSSTHGVLWVNHETVSAHPGIGDGGGASVMEVFRDPADGWKVIGFPYAIDFANVGGTLHNCLGALTPWGTILSSEGIEPTSNFTPDPDHLAKKPIPDSTDYNGIPRWKNYGWMVEVNPMTRKVLGKHYAMGRFKHGGAAVTPDEKTVYMCDEEDPCAFFKFVADTARKLSSGRLFAWRMKADTNGSHWIPLPRGRDSLMYARRYAFQRGASMFLRLEDIELLPDGTFLVSESGQDSANLAAAVALGGKVMPHLAKFHLGHEIYDDRNGRILRYDPRSETMEVVLEGGQAIEDRSIVLSNPGNLAYDHRRKLLVIFEDLNGTSSNRVPKRENARKVCEIYFLPLTGAIPRLDDLRRFAVLPPNCKGSGAYWTPDFGSLFFNIQNGTETGEESVPPNDRSKTVVVTGFPEFHSLEP
jgi:secreted PhoX family phosphatase